MNTQTAKRALPFTHPWVEGSIMATRGVGRGEARNTHHLTEEKQGKFHYTMGPYSEPVLKISPGDRIVVETRDAFEGAIRHETDKPSQLLRMPFLNPQNGPIMQPGVFASVAGVVEKLAPLRRVGILHNVVILQIVGGTTDRQVVRQGWFPA